MTVIRKTHNSEPVKTDKGIEFILSDATPDRYGDVIMAEGWDLKNFSGNPVALFNHNPDFPIGKWTNLKVVKGQLRGHLQLAPAGTSARIDEIRNLVEAGVLKAVSVGFLPIESEPITGGSAYGSRYKKSELVETSLVAIPANPNALAVAKSLNVSPETLDVVFAKHGTQDQIKRRGSSPASTPHLKTPSSTGNTNMTLGQRIAAAKQKLADLEDKLNKHIETLGDEPDDAAHDISNSLTSQIETTKKSIASFEKMEAALGDQTIQRQQQPQPQPSTAEMLPTRQRVFATPHEKETKPFDLLLRAIAVDIKHFGEGRKRPIVDVLKENYGDNQMGEQIRTVMARMVTKAATIPADTTTSGWADKLVQTVIGDFIEALMPYSVYPALRAKGGSFTFGRNGAITLPGRNTATSIGGAFVAQGAPIPVKQGAFTSISLTPKKMGVITTMTREITEHSTPQIESILRQAILEDTAIAIDTVLLDATAASAIRPAGLKNGQSKVNATAGGAVPAALIGDLKGLIAALITATSGNIRNPVWIMNPGDVLAASLIQTTTGDTPFREEIARGTLLGYPIIQSTTGLSDMMALMDAADFLTATGDVPQFSVSDQAVLHMEDTSPAAISTVATPNTVAAPVRSLWQTDTMAIRMIMDINWEKRRSGIFQWTDTMTWN